MPLSLLTLTVAGVVYQLLSPVGCAGFLVMVGTGGMLSAAKVPVMLPAHQRQENMLIQVIAGQPFQFLYAQLAAIG